MLALSRGNDLTIVDNEITVTHNVHRILASGTIFVINPPSPEFDGAVILFTRDPDGNLSVSLDSEAANSNIARSCELQANVAGILYYDPSLSLWFPSF